jgi:hypothetical protein
MRQRLDDAVLGKAGIDGASGHAGQSYARSSADCKVYHRPIETLRIGEKLNGVTHLKAVIKKPRFCIHDSSGNSNPHRLRSPPRRRWTAGYPMRTK